MAAVSMSPSTTREASRAGCAPPANCAAARRSGNACAVQTGVASGSRGTWRRVNSSPIL
ncbi:hypothetical protein PhCBS80983_g05824 [Powellomyces hirtus]|uniref:Uncharacterized protein n=1 Tax=Powellomyces hirtus TaxID=109895 RepID=A0A507DUZ1_9FUNG|nr:hypothetical protein PhCBS80983_g05824 [Powellomyces hirtus]